MREAGGQRLREIASSLVVMSLGCWISLSLSGCNGFQLKVLPYSYSRVLESVDQAGKEAQQQNERS